ncbi:hypothetical protein P6144_10790 [Sphingomonas sp. HITSZ_GF]|uniref:endonuclease/exonuclease/phosphatase family protein n=1 Tax=Sphingomonas sp. HITSZ_GF TaxID=3037247 RepID=UPI00240D146B|nr:endonuclease/exonuclease/phosphatase family protein [Sphingomonas sp. HITSZ_GF]MDG2534136.1 hypothetical protein [Sphingomonas sp. HITSZ_GF]
MATSITVLSWNVQILGDTKVNQTLVANLIARVIALYKPDIVTIQELVFSAAEGVYKLLVTALQEQWTGTWTGTAIQALPGGSDRDGYLFLWRNTVAQQWLDKKPVQGVFSGDWPNNISVKNGRRPGYCGFTLADGSHPFIVASYHAPTFATASIGSGPATGLNALATQANQLLKYPDGSGTAYEARFFCADFNMSVTDASGAAWFTKAMTATSTENATTGNTIMVPIASAQNSSNSATYYTENLDNVLAGPTGRMTAVTVIDTINLLQKDSVCKLIAESVLTTNKAGYSWGKGDTFTAFKTARDYLSDHVPLLVQFTLVP